MSALPRPLVAALGLTLAAALYLSLQTDDEEAGVAPVPPRQRNTRAYTRGGAVLPQPETPVPAWPIALPERDAAAWRPVGPAVAQAWGVPPPAAKPVGLPPPPTAPEPEPPALDYTLIGRVEDAGEQRALLMSPSRTLSLKVGDVVDGQWRVMALHDDGVDLVWQPTGQHRLIGYKTN